MNYVEAMNYIHKVGNFGSNYGLERVERLLELLGNPQKNLKVIHIGGTNGKGSTTAMITKMLMEEGYNVGMYTSPFLEEFEERIQINRNNIEKDKLAFYVEKIKDVVDIVKEEGLGNPTEFEIITCIMFKYFYDEKVDYAVVEVGLGGRLDATNVINPIISVLASISLDHMNILGNTIEEITREKCGIIKEGIQVITYPQIKNAMEIIEETAKAKNSKLIKLNAEDSKFINIEKINGRVYQKILIKGSIKDYILNMSLLGKHQILNGLVAVRVVEEVLSLENKEPKNIERAMEKVVWNGRLETLGESPTVIIDGAHNIDGISRLKENIEAYFKYNKKYLLIGILADKQVEEMIKCIVPGCEEIVALTPHSERAELAEELKTEIEKINKNVVSFKSYEDGFKYIYDKANKDDLIIATGSLYMIGEMRGIIRKSLNRK